MEEQLCAVRGPGPRRRWREWEALGLLPLLDAWKLGAQAEAVVEHSGAEVPLPLPVPLPVPLPLPLPLPVPLFLPLPLNPNPNQVVSDFLELTPALAEEVLIY